MTVNDGTADSDVFNLSVTVSASNDAPVITGQTALTTEEETDLAITLADLTVSDPDNSYPADFTLAVQNGVNYTRVGNAGTDFNGTLRTPGTADSDVFNLSVTGANGPNDGGGDRLGITLADLTVSDPDNSYPADFTLAVQDTDYTRVGNTFTPAANFLPVMVNDGTADSDEPDVTVSASNDAPVITGQTALTTEEETALGITLADLTVSDPDNSYPADFTLAVQDGTDYTRVGNTLTPAANFNGTLTVPVMVNDGTADSDVFNLSVTVSASNDAPVITGQGALTTAEETALGITLADLTVSDPDNSYPTGFTLAVQDGTNYTRAVNTLTPAANFNGTLTVPVMVNDGTADSNVFTLSVTVSASNDAPVITGQGALTTAEETALGITLADLTVSDPDNSYPADFTLAVQNGVNYTRVGNTLTPAADFNGTLTVPVTVNDGTADSDVFNLSVTVSASNDAPVITGQTALTTEEETALAITLADLTVSDPDNSYPADFTLAVQNGVNYTRVGSTLTPAADFNGTLTVPVTVNDGTTDSNVFHLSVMVTAAACHGDVNEDDLRNVLDVVKLIRHIVGLELLTGITLVNADITEEGGVNVVDVVKLIRHIVGLQPLSGCGPAQ